MGSRKAFFFSPTVLGCLREPFLMFSKENMVIFNCVFNGKMMENGCIRICSRTAVVFDVACTIAVQSQASCVCD